MTNEIITTLMSAVVAPIVVALALIWIEGKRKKTEEARELKDEMIFNELKTIKDMLAGYVDKNDTAHSTMWDKHNDLRDRVTILETEHKIRPCKED